jgi:SAM-dependent methyltransferase
MVENRPQTEAAVIRMDYARENADYRSRISQVTGVDPRNVSESDLRSFYQGLGKITPEFFSSSAYAKFISADENPYLQAEKGQRLAQLIEAYLDIDPDWFSYGLFMPTYLKELEGTKNSQSNPEEYHTLLAGALTIDTVRECNYATKAVFPQGHLSVIDLKAKQVAQYAPAITDFYPGNVLAMPFEAGSFDSVQTNILLDHLYPSPDYVGDFYQEAHRVLKPQGSLIMVEKMGYSKVQRIGRDLERAGYSEVTVKPAEYYAKRRYVDRAMRGQTADISTQHKTASSIYTIHATK